MARIRSVHPGLFTDEAFVTLSMTARVFLIGVWTEADDHGVFEWKPMSLKMRLFPADNIDASAVMDELAAADQVRRAEHEGKQYGIVRNFCTWQRPKKPTHRYPFPPAWVEYVAFKGDDSPTSTPPVPHLTRTAPGKRPQREEGGKEEREVGGGDKNGGGRSVTRAPPTRAKKTNSLPAKAEAALIAGPLLKQFRDAYRAPITKAAERKFLALLAAGENADPIIAAAHRANPEIPAEQWLDERAWTQLTLLPDDTRKPLISAGAMALGDEIATLAGQDLQFLEPGWCGAPWRCQEWLDQGWPRELIVAGVKAMVTQKAPEKISGVAYFDKGLARFIAQQTRPVPKIIEHQAETVEVTRAATVNNPRSGIAAIGRVYEALRGAATEAEPGCGGEMPDAPVQRLPA
jgi:hypothetical protein